MAQETCRRRLLGMTKDNGTELNSSEKHVVPLMPGYFVTAQIVHRVGLASGDPTDNSLLFAPARIDRSIALEARQRSS